MKLTILLLSVFFIGIKSDGHRGLSSILHTGSHGQSFRYPVGCPDNSCAYRASWRYLPSKLAVEFTIKARVKKGIWAGIGFSENQQMIDSDAVTGFYPQYGNKAVLKDRYLKGKSQFAVNPDPQQNVMWEDWQGSHVDGLLSFTFSRALVTGDPLDLPLNKCLFFLYAWGGNAYGESMITAHTMAMASQRRICIQTTPQPPEQTPPPTPYATQPPVYQTSRQPVYPTSTTQPPPVYQTQYTGQYVSRDPPQYIAYQTPSQAPVYPSPTTIRYAKPTETAYRNQHSQQNQQYQYQYLTRAPPQFIPYQHQNQYQYNQRFYQYGPQQTLQLPAHSPNEGYEDDGVFRYPKNCIAGRNCEYEAEWESYWLSEDIWFTIKAKVGKGHWAGIGFSDDRLMPNSDCITGHVQQDGHFVLADRWLSGRSPSTVTIDRFQDAYATSYGHNDGMLTFTFKRKRNTYDRQDKNLYNCVYFLFAWGGQAHRGGSITPHTHKIVSKNQICLNPNYGSVGKTVGTSYRDPTYQFLRRPMPHYYDPCQRITCKWNQYCVRFGNDQARCECRGRFRLVGTYCVAAPNRWLY